MTRISRFFIENYRFSMVMMVFVILFGVGGLFQLKSESYPTVNIGQVIITTVYPGASAEDIEAKITKPIEDEIRSVTGIDEVKSVSQPGLSQIFTVVDIDNYQAEKIVADLQRAIDRVPDLPNDLENPPSFMEVKTEEFPVIELAIIGSNENRIRDRAAIALSEALEDNKKISGIVKTGYRERQFNINLDPKKMDQYHISLDEVASKIQSQNLIIPGGSLENETSKTLIKIDGKRTSVEAIGDIVIRSNYSGGRVLLKNVATIADGQEDAQLLARHHGQPATLLTISKKSGADLIALAEEVKVTIDSFSQKYQGQLEFKIFNNEGVRVSNRLDVLSSNAVAGLLLVVVFLLLFLPGRAGLMAALSLPLATLATFALMNVSGMTFNTITILAMVISIGMLVDNSVVVSENYQRLTGEGLNSKEAVLKSVRDLWLPITATAFTTISAFLPMLVTKGVIGQFIQGIPIIVTAALLLSLVESFILLPVRLVRARDVDTKVNDDNQFEQRPKQTNGDWFTKYIQPSFNRLVAKLIKFRYLTLVVFTGIIFGSLYMMAVVNKFILFPAGQTELYIARVELPQGSRIEETDRKLAELTNQILAEFGPSIEHAMVKSGASQTEPNDPKSKTGENVGMAYFYMSDTAKNTLITNEVLNRMRSISVPGLATLSYEAKVNGPPSGDPVAGIFRSNNSQQLADVAQLMQEKLSATQGVFDVRIDDVYGEDEIIVSIDEQQASRLGLDLQTVGRSVRMAMAGIDVTDVNLDNREVDFFIRFGDQSRQNLDQLKQVKIMNRRGDLIPLAQLASLERLPGTPQIKRFDFKPAKTVTANVNDDVITAAEANALLADSFAAIENEYREVSLQFGGEGERIKESMTSLATALILAIIGIFALLVFLFKSYVKPLIILTTVPLGLLGVAVSFYFHDRPVSFLALIGVVGLSGIIVNSGIVLISFIDQMRRETTLSLNEILIRSTSMRLRAVIVTSLTTVSGLLPTAYGIGGADEFIIPMTLAMAWGLVSGTILALIWVPCAYAIVEDLGLVASKILRSKPKIDAEYADTVVASTKEGVAVVK